MLTSIATVSLSGALDEKLRAIADAGYDGVEIFENDFLTFNGTAHEVGAMARDLGLQVVTFQPFRDFEGLPGPQRARAFARAERKFDLMQELGTDLLMVCSSISPLAQGGIDRAAADLRELGDRAAGRGLRIGYEALSWGRFVDDYRDAWEIVRRADHPAVGLVLDSFHALARGLPVDPIASIPGDRVFLVQLADAPKLNLDLLSWSRHFRSFPGQGELDVRGFAERLRLTGYTGFYSLEIFNDQFRATSTRTTAVDGLRSLRALDDDLQPEGRHVLPPRSDCLGVEFVEFAMTEREAGSLRAGLAAMGFRHAGRHRSKAVERWSQGAINVVVNTETDGFASAHSAAHGPGVCAVALRVGDVETTMRRAEALKAATFTQPVAPEEIELQAIRGVGGSLLYFTEPTGVLSDIWSRDFVPLSDEPNSATGPHLDQVDHLAQSMRYDEMLSWLLFYSSLFDLERTPQVDLADPGGLVQSRVVEAPNGSVRVVLNGSSAPSTVSSRFLSEFLGAGTQHIAFSTPDAIASVRAMRAAGLAFLEVPENYYDDLEAKYDLDPAFLEELRQNAILYDRDGETEFLHAYTQSFEERFFFEIVERRGGYAGFGAVNAPVRLAAQSRSLSPVTMPHLGAAR